VVFTIITVEDKLELFRKAVLEKVEKEYEEKLNILEGKNAATVEEYEVTVIQKSKDYVKALTDQADYERRMLISKAKGKVRTSLMQKRQGIVEELIDLVRSEASKYTKTAEYEKYLKGAVASSSSELKRFKKIIIALDKNDFDNAKAILEKELAGAGFGKESFQFEVADEEIIGGVKFYNEGKSIRIDESFASLIEENSKLIGQYVYDMISEAGEK
jgi:vacuolar-type H+-ATPase subunit E/Vma4